MANKYNERKKRYSRSRSKSWSRDNYIQRQRRFKDQYKSYKSRYDEIKVPKDVFKQSHVSIDWKPKVNNQKNKHNYKYSRSHSASSSSSSSSSSSYSSSDSKSRISKRGQKKQKESWRKRSTERNPYRPKKNSHSPSDSRSYRKKQHYEKQKDFVRIDKKNDNQYIKKQRYEKDTKFEGNYQNFKSSSGGYKAPSNSNYYKKYQHTGYSNYNKYRNDDQKSRENENKKNIEIKKKWTNTNQINDTKGYQNKTKNQDKQGVQIQIGKKTIQQNFKQTQQTNSVQTIKRIETEIYNLIPQKEKISKVTQLINQSKKNLEITPLNTNFLILDSFRSMKKFNAETLDPTLLSWLQKDFQFRYEQQKTKVFGKQNIIGEQRQNARITLPSHPSEEQIQLKTQLQKLRGSMLTLNHLFRQLHMLQ